jgi:hypothetical protein
VLSSLHRFAAGAVSVLLLITLVLGTCLACAQPIAMKSAHAHPCCDPKGSCKPAPAQMDHTRCEQSQALLPEVVTPQPGTDAALLPVMADPAHVLRADMPPAVADTSPPAISPLQKSSLLRI